MTVAYFLEKEHEGNQAPVWVVQRGQLPQDPRFITTRMDWKEFERIPKEYGRISGEHAVTLEP